MNSIPMSQEMTTVLKRCMTDCVEFQQNRVTKEHVLYRLLENNYIRDVLLAIGCDVPTMREQLLEYIQELALTERLMLGDLEPYFTSSVEKMFLTIQSQNEKRNKKEANCMDFLYTMIASPEPDCYASEILLKFAPSKELLKEFLVKNNEVRNNERVTAQVVQDCLSNLNDLAKKGKIDLVVGRENEIERVIQVLCRRKKNNPVLVGEPGVGKTAIAEGLALRIAKGEVPDVIKKSIVFSLDIGQILAGSKFRGDFEDRMKELLKFIKKTPNAILFIDEIHTIIGAGAVANGSLDAANILKPALAQGDFKCMGSTTYKEYSHVFERDAAFARRFQKIDVVEPSVAETVQILKGLQKSLEKHHNVTYTDDSIQAAAELAAKHINDRFLPDKAIDVLDEAGSAKKIKGEHAIDTAFIEKIVAKIARIPEKTVTAENKSKVRNLAAQLKSLIFGQDQAVDSVVSSIELASSGLRTGEKPIGNFLFCGPTGVGKTELSKQLAESMGIPFIRFDMSEYSEKHNISRLIGAPPGYVGYDQEGMLTGAVRKNPQCVILLDEIEKSHSDIWNVLLQVMDHGTLTDGNGRKADFTNCILIMTSNVGAQEMSKRSLGLNTQISQVNQKPLRAVEQTFSPEFRNRLDEIVFFNGLTRENIAFVLQKNLKELSSQLEQKKVTLTVDSSAKEWLIENGYNPSMGARPMARLIQDKVKRILAPEMLHGKLEGGGHVRVFIQDGSLAFDYGSQPEDKPKKRVRKVVKPENESLAV
jgi:ATP-dependent Clp protease ATP-binding subunit ClpA